MNHPYNAVALVSHHAKHGVLKLALLYVQVISHLYGSMRLAVWVKHYLGAQRGPLEHHVGGGKEHHEGGLREKGGVVYPDDLWEGFVFHRKSPCCGGVISRYRSLLSYNSLFLGKYALQDEQHIFFGRLHHCARLL
jgi:hypothetical protein